MDLAAVHEMEHMAINGRHIWHYMVATTIGEIHIVEHEVKGELNIIDDYIGRSTQKAEQAFRRAAARMIKEG